MKKQLAMILGIMVFSTSNVYGGTWQMGAGENAGRWWYDCQDGNYAKDGWHWIDGNGDGTEECYYFDSEGWLLTDTVTPDGYTVNGDGAWTVNQAVQTRSVPAALAAADSMTDRNGRYVAYASGNNGEIIAEEDSDTTRVRYYLEEQSDGSIKFVTEWRNKDVYVDEIEKTDEMIFEKTGSNTYLYTAPYGSYYELKFSADGSFVKIYTWTNPLSGTVSTTEQYFRRALD